MLNPLDEQIIHLLGRDARQSSNALARQINVSSTTVRRRVRKLTQSKLLRIVGVVDPSNVGFPLAACIFLDVAHDKLQSVMQVLANRTEIKWVATTTGRFDILALGVFRSTDELSSFLETELPNMEGIRNIETFICLQVKKGRYVTP